MTKMIEPLWKEVAVLRANVVFSRIFHVFLRRAFVSRFKKSLFFFP